MSQKGDGETFIRVQRVIIHPNYGVENPHSADVALLELEVEAKLSDNIQMACLPRRSDVDNKLLTNKLLIR